jgi:hypothetical protein
MPLRDQAGVLPSRQPAWVVCGTGPCRSPSQAHTGAFLEYHVANHPQPHPESPDISHEQEPGQPEAGQINAAIGPETARDTHLAGTMRAGEAGSVADDDRTRWAIEVGADVIGACGHKVGEVVAVRDDLVVVEKGFFMPVDFYIPKSAIHHNNVHGLYLNVTKDEALHHGWDVDPQRARCAS